MKIRLPKLLLVAYAAAGAYTHAETITGEYVTGGYVKVTDSLNIGDGSTNTSYTVSGEESGESFVIAGSKVNCKFKCNTF